jgi:hypothetical protein
VVGGGVARGGDRLDDRVAELNPLAVLERDVLELDTRAGWEVGGRAGALDQRRQAGHVVGLNVRLEHRDDRDALSLGQFHVLVDQVDVGVDDGELAPRLAAEQVGGAGGVVVEQLAEEHGLTSYQLIY